VTPYLDYALSGASSILSLLWGSFVSVLSYPVDHTTRLFLPYVATSMLFGIWVLAAQHRREIGSGHQGLTGYVSGLFPREVWSQQSSKVDSRFFLPHQMVRIWIYGPFMAGAVLVVSGATHEISKEWLGPEPVFGHVDSFWTKMAITLLVALVNDFTAYISHWAQHKVPFLWEFHRVHHSAVVLNPLSNYREHPVDNIFYAIVFSLGLGLTTGGLLTLFGVVPTHFIIAGVAAPMFLFNVLGYHLRHSHIWIRWPGPFALLFGSPAHHQIHHSCKPEHIDKNLAFMFPIWDWLFGTYHLPKQRPEMIMGLGDGTESQYNSFARIYALPFIRLFSTRDGESLGYKS